MEEVATCACGGQTWLLKGNMLECTACRWQFNLVAEVLETMRFTTKKFIDQYHQATMMDRVNVLRKGKPHG